MAMNSDGRCHTCVASQRSFFRTGIFEMCEKNKEFLFLISKKKVESLPNILVTRNLNWFQILDKRIDCIFVI